MHNVAACGPLRARKAGTPSSGQGAARPHAPGRRGGGDAAARSWTARALELPAGRALVALVLFVGGRQIWIGVGRGFLERLDLARMQAIARQPLGMALLAVTAVGLLAYAAFAFIEGAHRRLAGR